MERNGLDKAVLMFIYDSLKNGKTAELEALGVDIEAMRVISKMPILELSRAIRNRPTKLLKRMELDTSALKELMVRTLSAVQVDETVNKLIERGAHHRMLKHFFGISKQEYATYRRLLNVDKKGRRALNGKRLQNRTERAMVIDLVRQNIRIYLPEKRGVASHQCDALLSTSHCTNIPVADIWETVDRAELAGEFSWDG